METKKVWQYDQLTNKLVGEVILNETDKGAVGEWLLHGGCVEVTPPAQKENFDIYWTGTAWEYREIEKESEPEKSPEPTLEELKQQKINLFKNKRDTEEISIIEYNNNKFDYDDKSRERMRIAEKALVDNNLTSQLWTCADNTQTTLTVDDFKNINTVVAQRSALLHTKYNELKMTVNACESKEELEKIEWV